ncbi:unnamed protein product [Cuscuta campestris]|uniref:CG-1 domain-containing protein n=1 Tax=Cuscuta campestris TaxID=132261 RepID=A0A484KFR4_9ASTE|nr:unnamed protein product [Cuscuta campestris]
MSGSGYNYDHLVGEAKTRWLKAAEVLFILQNHENLQISHVLPEKPPSGSLFLYNKRVLRFFRKDGHRWRRKKDGRAGGEGHERLKVGNVEALNCYYAHGEQNPNFQRRIYWMLNPAHEHIVLVHYRDISQGKHTSQFIPRHSPSSTFNQSPSPFSIQYTSSTSAMRESCEQQSTSAFVVTNSYGINQSIHTVEEDSNSSMLAVSDALRRIEEQLSTKCDSLNDIEPLDNSIEHSVDVDNIQDNYKSFNEIQDDSNTGNVTDNILMGHEGNGCKEMLTAYGSSTGAECNHANEMTTLLARDPLETSEVITWQTFCSEDDLNLGIDQQVEDIRYPTCRTPFNIGAINHDQFGTPFEKNQIGSHFEDNTCLTIPQRQNFRISGLCPDWGYTDETTKVIVTGSFHCDSSVSQWMCMFGDVEVPIQIIQDGVFCCYAPPHLPGKVTLCITMGDQESCSEVRDFEYRVKHTGTADNCLLGKQCTGKGTEELVLLVRFAKMLLFEKSRGNVGILESGNEFLEKAKETEDSWNEVILGILSGDLSSNLTIDWLLEELLKDKLQQWLAATLQGKASPLDSDCVLSRKEQGVIHMVAGLGFEWALRSILDAGVAVDFRDINGRTALHWAARFGRENMVAALIAHGASAGAVTDPTKEDLIGQSPAAIAATYGHNGLAGYLSEMALTSHLSSLTLEETELSKGDTQVMEAETAFGCIYETDVARNEDQISMKDTLAAARNATIAAARIQAAFRAHSFRKRQQRQAAAAAGDEFVALSNCISGFPASSTKLTYLTPRDYTSAALTIQKKYRGWKGRKDFLAFRQKVIKIQAHVRGYRARKEFRVSWATGVLEKIVLRWCRHGVGLRGFNLEMCESDDCDEILKVFRKQKVDATIEEAVSRVLSMVQSPEARQQYSRILEKYRQAKANLPSVAA